MTSASLSRRGFLTLTSAAGVVAAARPSLAVAATGPILKPIPPEWFVPFGTNAEMRWDSVDPRRYRTTQERLFVRNHTVDADDRRGVVPVADLRRRPRDARARRAAPCRCRWPTCRPCRRPRSPPCTSAPATAVASSPPSRGGPPPARSGRSAPSAPSGGTACGCATSSRPSGWTRARSRSRRPGLDDPYVTGGVDYGRVRRPFPVAKALDDAFLAWGVDGDPLLPDHGFPLRLVLPGWVGIASIKWLGSLEVSTSELTSPWNTKWYRMTGGDFPADSPPLTVNPVRSAWELAWDATLPAEPVRLTGRSWSGAAPIARVDVSLDGGRSWRPRSSTAPVARSRAGPGGRSSGRVPDRAATSCSPGPRTPPAALSRSSRRTTTTATSSTPSCATRSGWPDPASGPAARPQAAPGALGPGLDAAVLPGAGEGVVAIDVRRREAGADLGPPDVAPRRSRRTAATARSGPGRPGWSRR